MNTTLQLINVLTTQPGELEEELAELDIFDHCQLTQTLIQLTRGTRSQLANDSDVQRNVVRLHQDR
jgi:hypothetical protein